MPFIFLLMFLLSFSAHAAENNSLFEWQSTNIQILHGAGFKLSDHTQTTFTFEHANGWKYGDNFFYVDYVFDRPDESNAEFSPRLSLGKMSGKDLSLGIIKDFLLAGTLEKGRNFEVYLYGLGVDLDVPHFNFLQVNGYIRNNPDFSDHGYQMTAVWSLPFEAAGLPFTFDGYFDYANYEEGTTNFFTQPQLLLDLGAVTGQQESRLFAGIEYNYWHNKFGIEGVTQSAPQAMVKLLF